MRQKKRLHQKIPQKKLDERTITAWKEIQHRINTSKNKESKGARERGKGKKGEKGGKREAKRRGGKGRRTEQRREDKKQGREEGGGKGER